MNDKTLIIAKGRGGLGNRCLALVPLIEWAARYGVPLFVDWRDGLYSEVGENAFGKTLCLSGIESAVESLADLRGKVFPACWSGNLGLSANALLQKLAVPSSSRLFHKDIAVDIRSPPAKGVCVHCAIQDVPSLRPLITRFRCAVGQHRARIAWLRRASAGRLVFSETVDTVATSSTAQLGLADNVLGIHFRNSDRKSDIYAVVDVAKTAIRRMAFSEAFLATDDEAAERVFRRELGIRVSVFEKQFPAAGGAIHVARREIGADRILLDASVELSMLSKCSGLVVNPSSTFGILAAVLGGQSVDKVFFAGEPWLSGIGRTLSWEALG